MNLSDTLIFQDQTAGVLLYYHRENFDNHHRHCIRFWQFGQQVSVDIIRACMRRFDRPSTVRRLKFQHRGRERVERRNRPFSAILVVKDDGLRTWAGTICRGPRPSLHSMLKSIEFLVRLWTFSFTQFSYADDATVGISAVSGVSDDFLRFAIQIITKYYLIPA